MLRVHGRGLSDIEILWCTSCAQWQVDYSPQVARGFIHFDENFNADPGPWLEVLERVVAEHMEVCLDLQAFLGTQ